MAERDHLLRALKQVLKQRGMRYADLAAGLGVSEPTVKRMLSTGRIDLARLERVCALLEIDLFELARLARGGRGRRATLDQAQEAALAAEPRLLLVFHLLCNDWTVPAIRREFDLDAPEATLLLARLDRLRLIELLPRDRVRLRVARDFEWREDGPIRRRYAQVATGEFLRDAFGGRDALLVMEVRELADSSIAVLRRKLEHLAAEFREMAAVDATLPPTRRRSVGMLLALRPWVFSLLDSLREPGPPRGPAKAAGPAEAGTSGAGPGGR